MGVKPCADPPRACFTAAAPRKAQPIKVTDSEESCIVSSTATAYSRDADPYVQGVS